MELKSVVLTTSGQLVVDGIGQCCKYDQKDKCTIRCAMFQVSSQADALFKVSLGCSPIEYEDVLGEYFEDAASEIEGG